MKSVPLLAAVLVLSVEVACWSVSAFTLDGRKGLCRGAQSRLEAVVIQEEQMELETGVSAQVLWSNPPESKLPPLIFVHGSFHAAWCWNENYLEHFASLGYPVAAISLRGTGGTFAGEGIQKVSIDSHASDLGAFLHQIRPMLLSSDPSSKPLLISHSFGGLAVMKYLEANPIEAGDLLGLVFMCSVPPSGNGPMTLRFLTRSLMKSWKITAGFALQRSIKNADLCRDLFFGGPKAEREDGTIEDFGVSDGDIQRFQSNFKRDTEAIIDVSDLIKKLPSRCAVDGRAPYLEQCPPVRVVGASRDFIVDRQGVEELAEFFDASPPLIIDSPHDVMIGSNWRNGADAIEGFVKEILR